MRYFMENTKDIPILFKNKDECCGCSACEAICPQNAIIMTVDFQGFKYPEIKLEKCISCKKCIEVCTFK